MDIWHYIVFIYVYLFITGKGSDERGRDRHLRSSRVRRGGHLGGDRRRDGSGGRHHRGHPAAGHGAREAPAAAAEQDTAHRAQLSRHHQGQR